MNLTITSKKQYKKYMREFESLMKNAPPENTLEAEQLGMLTQAIEKYQKRYHFRIFPQ